MKRDTVSGALLIGSTLVALLALLRHPTGLLGAGDDFARQAQLAIAVHAIVITTTLVAFLGFFGLRRRLAATPDLATAGLVVYGFAVLCVAIAAGVSGFVGTALAEHYLGADEGTRHVVHEIFHYNSMLNQAYAKMNLAASAAASLLWSIAMLKSRALGLGLGLLGLAAGAGTIAGVVFGPDHIGVHAVMLYAGAQGAWTVWTGLELIRGQESKADA